VIDFYFLFLFLHLIRHGVAVPPSPQGEGWGLC